MKKRRSLTERTFDLAQRVIRLYRSLPKHTEAQVIGKQLLRSGMSVGAQMREAVRARTPKEYASKVHIALQELEESLYWVQLLQSSHIIAPARLMSLADEMDQMIRILITVARSASTS